MAQHSDFSLARSFRHSRSLVLLATIIVVIVTLCTTVATAWYLRQQVEDRTRVSTENLVRSIEQNIVGMIDLVDLSLLHVADEMQHQYGQGGVDAQRVTRFIERELERQPSLAYIRATNEAGDVVYGRGLRSPSPIHIADRDYYMALRAQSHHGTLLRRVMMDSIGKKWVWLFVRRIAKPDGSFGGVVCAAIAIDKLNADFAKYELDAGGSIGLRESDLSLVTRRVVGRPNTLSPTDRTVSSSLAAALRANPIEGTYGSGATGLDRLYRTHSYRRNPRYGFLVNVGMSGHTYLAQWRKHVYWASGLAGAFVLTTLALAALVLRYWRDHGKNLAEVLAGQRALAQSEARFRSLFSTMSEGFALHRIVYDEQGRAMDYDILEVNPAFEAQTGLEREQVVGRRATLVYGVDPAPFLDLYADVARSQSSCAFEHYFEPLRRHFLVHVFCPGPNQFATVFEDITERKRLQALQDESHRQLAAQYQEIVDLQDKLLAQAMRDPLTGLHNRRYMDETLPTELARAKREGYPLSLIMVDVDHFKKVNDTFGHAVGDEVLCAVASILKKYSRETDTVCRYGGEEFLIAMPSMTAGHARNRINRCREELERTPIPHGDLTIRVTLSAGVSAFPDDGADMDCLTARADEAMYQSKRAGRNCVTLASSLVPSTPTPIVP